MQLKLNKIKQDNKVRVYKYYYLYKNERYCILLKNYLIFLKPIKFQSEIYIKMPIKIKWNKRQKLK